MIMAAAQREVLLSPDDLSTQLEPAIAQVGGDNVAVQRAVPHIGDIAGKQRIGLLPVGAVVVEHFAARQPAATVIARCSPGRVVLDAIRRIGDHQVRGRSRQHRSDIGFARAVAAANPGYFSHLKPLI